MARRRAPAPGPSWSLLRRCLVRGGCPTASADRRRLAWHLPGDSDARPLSERKEILGWVRNVVVSGGTEYRRFQAAAMKLRYSVRFPGFSGKAAGRQAGALD